MGKADNSIDAKKVSTFIVDLITIVLTISIVNLIIIYMFRLSPNTLMREGIQTSVLEDRARIYDFISLGFFALIIFYLVFARKYFSLGDKIINRHSHQG